MLSASCFQRRRFFLVFPIIMEVNDPQDMANLDPGAWLAGFIKETTKDCYVLNLLDLSLMVSEIFEDSLAT